MERRLLTFIVASTAFFLVYFTLRARFAPPRPGPIAEQAEQEVGPDGQLLVDDEDQQATDGDAETKPEEEPAQQEEPAPVRPARPQWVTLGSMAPDSGYYLLVTLNSRGGGIERVELTEREEDGGFKYRRVDVRHGYLGFFAGEPASTSSGVLVNVVGPGTPADLAGVKAGDVILAVARQPVATREELDMALVGTKPGQEISVEVLREQVETPIVLKATLTQHPLDLIRLAKDGGTEQINGNLSRLSCLVSLSQVNRKAILPGQRSVAGVENPSELIWNLDQTPSEQPQSVSFVLDLSAAEMKAVGGGPIRMQRSYALQPSSYTIDMSIQVDNVDSQTQDLAYRLEGANGLTLEGWWYSTKISPNFSGAAARDIVFKTAAEGHQLKSGFELLKRAKKQAEDPNETLFAPDGSSDERNMKYIGVDAQYFTVAYLPPEGTASLTTFRRASAGVAAEPGEVPRHQERAVNSTFYLDSVVVSVPSGGSLRQNLRLFAGPKQPELLREHELQDCIYYGWFSTFAKLLGSLLHVLSGVGNYALAIILLTVIVRGAMFPLSRKAAVNAQKMQELAPELKKINEKYKDDMEGKLKAQRELQQRVGFNPLAGCLPMFLQLPIFIGLYRALSVDIELRQQAFFSGTGWASNLAGPDMFYYWGDWLWEYLSGRGTGWLGPYFNILPVLVVVLFLAQQKMFMPPATDEQTAMTQKMMNIMTLMMGLFFFRVPAGLCIYFITSSLWGICERVLVKKTLPTGKHFDTAVLEGTARPTETKTPTLSDRIRSQMSKEEKPVEPPHKRKRPNKKKK